MIISERIFKILKERGMTQKQFAELTGITASTISDWNTKKTNPSSDKIMTICNVLGITPYELLDDNCSGYVMIKKDSIEYQLLEKYQKADEEQKDTIIRFLQKL